LKGRPGASRQGGTQGSRGEAPAVGGARAETRVVEGCGLRASGGTRAETCTDDRDAGCEQAAVHGDVEG
jgi:hypothetical protein